MNRAYRDVERGRDLDGVSSAPYLAAETARKSTDSRRKPRSTVAVGDELQISAGLMGSAVSALRSAGDQRRSRRAVDSRR